MSRVGIALLLGLLASGPAFAAGPLLEVELAVAGMPTESSSANDGEISAKLLDLQPRGAMLDQCRFRMRDVVMIGHGASTDGRPEACRLLSYMRRWRMRYAGFARRRLRLPGIVDRPAVLPTLEDAVAGLGGDVRRGRAPSDRRATATPHTAHYWFFVNTALKPAAPLKNNAPKPTG